MLSRLQVSQFEADGFLKGGRILSDPQVEELREELERMIRDRNKGGRQPVILHNMTGKADQAVWQIVNTWEASDPFAALVRNPTITGEVAQLIAAQELRVWHDQIQYKPANAGGVNMWHQDWPYWGILSAPTQVTAWVALDDVDEANGCMSMIPGSHHWGHQMQFLQSLPNFKAMPAHFDGHDLRVQPCPVGKGAVHYHHAMTWHGSCANTSGRPRRALAIHLMTEQTRYLASGANHCMRPFVTVADGETLSGEHFPLVWKK